MSEDTVLWVANRTVQCVACERDINKHKGLFRTDHLGMHCLDCVDGDELVFLESGNGSVTRRVSTQAPKRYVVARQRAGHNHRLGILVPRDAFETICASRLDVFESFPWFLADESVDAFRVSKPVKPKRERTSKTWKKPSKKSKKTKSTSKWKKSSASVSDVLASLEKDRQKRAKFQRKTSRSDLKRSARIIGPKSEAVLAPSKLKATRSVPKVAPKPEVVVKPKTKPIPKPQPLRTKAQLSDELQLRFPSMRKHHADKVASWAFKNLGDVERAEPGSILSRYLRR